LELKDITVAWLKDNHYDIYFFGLGFIQVKIDESNRIHFYHSDLPAFVEDPHDHRYDFISKVLKGRLINEVWEERATKYSKPANVNVEYVCCQQNGEDLEVPDHYPAQVEKVGSFEVNVGSSYYIYRDTFHAVRPDFSVGPCVTWVTRTSVDKEHARVLRFNDDDATCPFSKTIEKDELWQIVETCLT